MQPRRPPRHRAGSGHAADWPELYAASIGRHVGQLQRQHEQWGPSRVRHLLPRRNQPQPRRRLLLHSTVRSSLSNDALRLGESLMGVTNEVNALWNQWIVVVRTLTNQQEGA